MAYHSENGRKLAEEWEKETREAMGSSPRRDTDCEDYYEDSKDDKDLASKGKEEEGKDDKAKCEKKDKTLTDKDNGQQQRTKKDKDDDEDLNGSVLMTQTGDDEDNYFATVN